MKAKDDKYVIIADGKLIKHYKSFKDAVWDIEFYQLMYKEVNVYQLVVRNGEQV